MQWEWCEAVKVVKAIFLHYHISFRKWQVFHSRLFRHIHKFSYSYHTLKKTLIMFDSIVFVKYPIREFCTPPVHCIMWYLLMGIFFSWLDGPSLFGNKNVILDEMFQRNASKFVIFWNLKIQLVFFISYSKIIANFEVFCWNISPSINFLFLKSVLPMDYWLRILDNIQIVRSKWDVL